MFPQTGGARNSTQTPGEVSKQLYAIANEERSEGDRTEGGVSVHKPEKLLEEGYSAHNVLREGARHASHDITHLTRISAISMSREPLPCDFGDHSPFSSAVLVVSFQAFNHVPVVNTTFRVIIFSGNYVRCVQGSSVDHLWFRSNRIESLVVTDPSTFNVSVSRS